MVGNEKSQRLSSRGLPEESETHPDLDPSAIIEGVITHRSVFFWDTLYIYNSLHLLVLIESALIGRFLNWICSRNLCES